MVDGIQAAVAVVDDDSLVLKSVVAILSVAGHQVIPFSCGEKVLAAMDVVAVDVFLTDVCMPGMNGLELMEEIRRRDGDAPVILMTGFPDVDVAVSAIKKGAHDFIIKPFSPEYLLHAVDKAIRYRRLRRIERNYRQELERMVVERSDDLADALDRLRSMSQETIARLTSAAELRDEDTGRHISRIGLYTGLLSREMGLGDDFIETIRVASAMHDVGKIGIPDAILHKQGRLTPEEYEVMKQHTIIGERFLRGSSFPMLQMAASIALSHHERWDGSGYPHGLRAEEIPLEARIVMLVDQYDALRSVRVYKPAYSHQEACRIIIEGDGRTMPRHFDRRVLDAFSFVTDDFEDVFNANRD